MRKHLADRTRLVKPYSQTDELRVDIHQVHVGRTLLVGFLCWLVALPATFLPSVKDLPSPWPILLPSAVGLLVALVLAFIQAAIPTSKSSLPKPSGGGSGIPLLIASVTIVIVIRIGGLVGS